MAVDHKVRGWLHQPIMAPSIIISSCNSVKNVRGCNHGKVATSDLCLVLSESDPN